MFRQNLTLVAHIVAEKNIRRKINKNHTFYHIYYLGRNNVLDYLHVSMCQV